MEFGSRSPTPAVLTELGWTRWSTLYKVEITRVLSRIMLDHNTIIPKLLEKTESAGSSWTAKAVGIIEPWCSTHEPTTEKEWRSLLDTMIADLRSIDTAKLVHDAGEYENVSNYKPVKWMSDGSLGVNLTYHQCKLSRNAVAIHYTRHRPTNTTVACIACSKGIRSPRHCFMCCSTALYTPISSRALRKTSLKTLHRY